MTCPKWAVSSGQGLLGIRAVWCRTGRTARSRCVFISYGRQVSKVGLLEGWSDVGGSDRGTSTHAEAFVTRRANRGRKRPASPFANRAASRLRSRGANRLGSRIGNRRKSPSASRPPERSARRAANHPQNRRENPPANPRQNPYGNHPGNRSRNGSHRGSRNVCFRDLDRT